MLHSLIVIPLCVLTPPLPLPTAYRSIVIPLYVLTPPLPLPTAYRSIVIPLYVLTPPLPLPAAYRNEEGVPWVLPVVRAVEQQMAADETLNKEYLPQEGMGALQEVAVRLVLGAGSKALMQNRVREGRQGSHCVVWVQFGRCQVAFCAIIREGCHLHLFHWSQLRVWLVGGAGTVCAS